MSPTTRKFLIGAAVGAAVLVGGAGIAAAAGGPDLGTGDDDEPALTGSALERASAAALEASREYGEGGTVTSTEGADEEPYYEVTVTLPDGTEVDVDVDAESFTVLGTPEVEGQDDEAGEVDDSGQDEETGGDHDTDAAGDD